VIYLSKRNGEGWWEKFLEEESKLEKLVILPLPEKKRILILKNWYNTQLEATAKTVRHFKSQKV